MVQRNIRSTAFNALARRGLTKKELADKLLRKKFSDDQVSSTVEELHADGYIDECAIAEDHIRLGKESRLVGRFLLRFELLKRGIDEDQVQIALDKNYPESDEAGIALKFAERKLGTYNGISAEKRYRRLSAAVGRRGFNSEIIRSVLDELDVSPYENNNSRSI